ncbi:MAG TPA: beta-Ala-His dipeptidase [Anaerolineae bacterium]|nr:beta-Ala-His dipeptidase [Anaerolineae bacterium]
MKGVLKGIKPERPLYYFEVMSNIVRGSSYEKPMSDYLVAFAKERGFEVHQDELYNILIKAPGVAGGEKAKPVVLHGHMDMVWNKDDGVEHDFFKDPLDLYIDDGWVKARGTTLGADNGIGVAYMLALLESEDIPHPPLECVITVMEEMGKKGLAVFDPGKITAKRMIDFNWIHDKEILAGCSGDVSFKITMPAAWEPAPAGMVPMSVKVTGLQGGHCEWNIHQQRANAIILLARLLNAVGKEYDFRLAKFEGGVQNNVIPSIASAELLVKSNDKAAVVAKVKTLTETYKKELVMADPDLTVQVSETSQYPEKVFGAEAGKKLTTLVHLIPDGLIGINLKVETDLGFMEAMASIGSFPTETGNNLGILRTEGDEVWMITTITSAVTSRKHDVADRIRTIVELVGGGTQMEQFGVDAPEFPYVKDSEMVKLAEQAYKEYHGFMPKREVNCCSLQLGMLIEARGLDCVGIGTEIEGVHSPREMMKLESVANSWGVVKTFMKNLCTA